VRVVTSYSYIICWMTFATHRSPTLNLDLRLLQNLSCRLLVDSAITGALLLLFYFITVKSFALMDPVSASSNSCSCIPEGIESSGRILVICIDGTANQFSEKVRNLVHTTNSIFY
jgi:hypothetical protein